MVSRVLTIVIGIVILGTTSWAQSSTLKTDPGVLPGTYSSSKSLKELASASFSAEPLPDIVHNTTPDPNSAALIATPITPIKNPQTPDKATQARNKKIWFSLMAVEHSAAGFDAWSTRQGIGGNVQESNPLLKPFANSNAMYAATQAVPVGMDVLAHYMMRSSNPVVRKLWWLPQTASTVGSLVAGFHNLSIR